MENSNTDSKVVVGVLIGGIVGIGALAVFLALRKKDTSLEHIGKMVGNVGEVLENHQIETPTPIKSLEKTLCKNEDTIGVVVDWIATGINLWKKFNS